MRALLLSLVIICALAVDASPRTGAASDIADPAPAATARRQAIDDNGDTRVEVQLVVLGIAIGSVFVLGTGAYVLRKKLGLVPPPPEQGTDGHH
jgi:hypothetical protein